ncbi:MAG: FtsX-like permease family protein [Candidatus Dormibacteria bacterium]
MWRLATRELRGQWRLTGLLALGLILAAMAYVALLGTASGSSAELTGDVGKAWRTPYDLLVRPSGDLTPLERQRGLVSPNFISSINGGISQAQLRTIRRLPGVSVAAPIAIVGYTTIDYQINVPQLASLLASRPLAVIRVAGTATAEDGLAHYPLHPEYYVIAPHGHLTVGNLTSTLSYAGGTIQCNDVNVQCEVGTTGTVTCPGCVGSTAFPDFAPLDIPIPVMVAGIDPRAEAKLTGIDKLMTTGRFLPMTSSPVRESGSRVKVPIILSTQSFISEAVDVQADLAGNPLAALAGTQVSSLSGWQSLYSDATSVQQLYSKAVAQPRALYADLPNLVIPGQVKFREISPAQLQAETTPSRPGELVNPNCLNCGQTDTPVDAHDTWYRQLEISSASADANYYLDDLGTFDAREISGFNILAGGNLSAYAPPQAVLANGKTLAPTRNPAGFITSPPLVLTTLAGAQYFADSYSKGAGPAFISAIRIRVPHTGRPSDAAQSRLLAVAQAIHQKTGLAVSLVKGSSAVPIRVTLPPGKFGTPELQVTQYWGEEGAAIDFLRGLNDESLALFGLTLGVVLVLLGVIGQLAARRRRPDFALLRALGWPLARVVRLAALEMALLGLAIGVAAALVGVAATRALNPSIPVLPLLAVVPLVALLAVVAPLPALLSAARPPVGAVLRGTSRIGRPRVRSMGTLAARDLLGPWRLESLLCVGASTIGSGLVGGVVLVVGGFSGSLGPSTLGRYLASQIGPLDIVLIAIAVVAGTGTSATLLTLAYLERQAEFSTLRAIGWPRTAVALVVAIQALILAVGGGIVAAGLVAGSGLAIAAPSVTAWIAPLVAVGTAVMTAGLAMAGTMYLAYRVLPAAALRSL